MQFFGYMKIFVLTQCRDLTMIGLLRCRRTFSILRDIFDDLHPTNQWVLLGKMQKVPQLKVPEVIFSLVLAELPVLKYSRKSPPHQQDYWGQRKEWKD